MFTIKSDGFKNLSNPNRTGFMEKEYFRLILIPVPHSEEDMVFLDHGLCAGLLLTPLSRQ
jgi:hypothetical protein